MAVRFGSLLAELDALNRGLVEIGVLAAEDRARIERLEARVTVIFIMCAYRATWVSSQKPVPIAM